MRNIVILTLFVTSNAVSSQGGFKQTYYFPNNTACFCKNAFEAPGGNLFLVGLGEDTIRQATCLTVASVDPMGNMLWKKAYGNKYFQYADMPFSPRSAIVKDQNGFYHACVALDSSSKFCSVLIRFNFNGDSLWAKRYYSNQDSVNLYVCSMACSVDGGLLMTGVFEDFKLHQESLLLLRTDANGNELWRKKISKATPNVNGGLDLVQDSATKRIVIVGFQRLGNAQASDMYGTVFIMDSLGNEIKRTAFTNSGGGVSKVIQLHDKSFLCSGVWTEYYQGNDAFYSDYLVKFDINANIIWKKNYGNPDMYSGIGPVCEKANGNLLGVGGVSLNFGNDIRIRLREVDSQGNLMKTRVISRPPYSDEWGRSLNPVSDGGYIIASSFPYDYPTQPFSIIKIDSLSCDTSESFCKAELEVGLSEQFRNNLFEIFQNPADDYFDVKIQDLSKGSFQIQVVDLCGRNMKEVAITSETEARISTIELNAGIYFVNLSSDGSLVESRKLVVKH